MAAPVHQANGTTQALATAITVGWPAHAVNDLGILAIDTSNQPNTLPTPNGMTLLGQAGIGTAGAAGAVALQLWHAFATSSSMGSPVTDDAGDHQIGAIATYRGAYIGRAPQLVGFASGTGTAITSPGGTTDADGALVLMVVAHGIDTSSPAQVSAQANASLSGILEDFEAASTINNGGGIAIASGIKATAGSFSGWTATLASSANWVAATVVVNSLAAPANLITVTGTPTFEDDDTTPTFSFSISAGTAEYSIDGGGYSAAVSPLTLGTLALGSHTLTIRSVETPANAVTYTWTIGAAADASAPTIDDYFPADRALTPQQAFSFTVTDETELLDVAIIARFPSGTVDVVWFDDAFRGRYRGGPNARVEVTAGQEYRFTVLRDGGWLEAPTFELLVRDAAGNLGVAA